MPPRKKNTALPPHVTSHYDGHCVITPINSADVPTLASLLLAAADHPDQVRTVTGPTGWVVPPSVATAAGLG